MNRMILKSLCIWIIMLPLAIANGALREFVLIPLTGRAAHAISGILLCIILFLIVSIFLPRLGSGTRETYIKMGIVWIICTVILETLLGLLSGDSIAAILNNYNLFTGNLWLLVVIFFGCAPWLAAKRKGII